MTALGELPRIPAVASIPRSGSGTVLVGVRFSIGTAGAVATVRSNITGVTVTKESAAGTYTIGVATAKDLWGAHVTIVEDTPLTRVSFKSVANDELVVHCYAGAIVAEAYEEALANPVSGDEIHLSFWGEF